MSLKQKVNSVIPVYGVSVDVGANFYRQLFAEVNTLVKIKRGTHNRVIMHGNTNYGFVKPLSEDRRLGTNQMIWALHHSNRHTFTERIVDGYKKLRYEYHKCLLSVMTIHDAHTAPISCSIMDNMSRLVEHKLLHFTGTGVACEGCGRKGTLNDNITKKFNSRISNLSLKEMHEEKDDVADESDLTEDNRENEPIVVGVEQPPTNLVSINDRMLDGPKGSNYKVNVYKTNEGGATAVEEAVRSFETDKRKNDKIEVVNS